MCGDTYMRLFTNVCACVDIYIYRKDDLFPTSRDPPKMILGHDSEKKKNWNKINLAYPKRPI